MGYFIERLFGKICNDDISIPNLNNLNCMIFDGNNGKLFVQKPHLFPPLSQKYMFLPRFSCFFLKYPHLPSPKSEFGLVRFDILVLKKNFKLSKTAHRFQSF